MKLFFWGGGAKWVSLLRVSPRMWPSQPHSLSPWSARLRQPWADLEKLFLGMMLMMCLWQKRKVKGEGSWSLFGYLPFFFVEWCIVGLCLMEQLVFLGSKLKSSPHFRLLILMRFLWMCRTSGEASLESQSELEPAQPSDDASLPSTSQEPTSSSAPGMHTRAHTPHTTFRISGQVEGLKNYYINFLIFSNTLFSNN